MKTYTPKANDIKRQWHVVDVSDQILGRISTEIALLLTGKNKSYFTAHLDCGDYVVVTNADKIRITGTKMESKVYYHHSGYPGALKSATLKEKMEKDPRKVIEAAVKGMLPKNKLRDKRMRRLKVFTNATHPYNDKLQASQDSKKSDSDIKQ